jgi:hypothetical protein
MVGHVQRRSILHTIEVNVTRAPTREDEDAMELSPTSSAVMYPSSNSVVRRGRGEIVWDSKKKGRRGWCDEVLFCFCFLRVLEMMKEDEGDLHEGFEAIVEGT